MTRKVRTHKFNGVKHHIDIDGGFVAIWEPPSKEHHIRLAINVNSKKGLQAIIHECLHAADYSKDEATVDRAGDEIGNLLYRLLRSGQIKIKAKGE